MRSALPLLLALLLATGLVLLAVGGPRGPGAEGIVRSDEAGGDAPSREEGVAGAAGSEPVLEGRGLPSPAPPPRFPFARPAPISEQTTERVETADLTGHVVGAGGRALEGVVVSARLHRGRAVTLECVATDRAGRFAVPDVPIESTFYLDVEPADVEAEGTDVYGERVVGPVSAADGPVAIVLEVQAVIAGTVLDEDGDPLPARAVTLFARRVEGEHRELWQAVNLADGAFSIGPLPVGPYEVWTESPSDLLAPAPLLRVSAPAKGARIVVPDAGVVEGTVEVDDPAGYDVGWTLRLEEGVTVTRSVMLGGDGRFRVGGVGRHPVTLWARGFGCVALHEGVLAGEGFVLRPDRGVRIEGMVRFVDVDVSQGFPSFLLEIEEESSGYVVRGVVANGHFHMLGLPAGGTWRPRAVGGEWTLLDSPRLRAGAEGVVLSVSPRTAR